MNIEIVAIPPKTLTELSNSIEKVDNQRLFFGRDLYVINKKIDLDQAITLAKIMTLFLGFLENIKSLHEAEQEIKNFKRAYTIYAFNLEKQQISKNVQCLINCGRFLIENELSSVEQPIPDQERMTPIMLITDTDGYGGCGGAMAKRVANTIAQELPISILLPYSLLLNIIQATFNYNLSLSPTHDESRQYQDIAVKATKILANSSKWKISKNIHCNFVALVPIGVQTILNLEDYLEVKFDNIREQARRIYAFDIYKDQNFINHDIIKTLSTNKQKNIVWAGHGDLSRNLFKTKAQAMGLQLPDVVQILNDTKKVGLWNLHSCFLLGNIRKIVHHFLNENTIICLNNGEITESKPLLDDECLHAFFKLSSKCLNQKDEKVSEIFSRAHPWKSGLDIANHPHLIFKKSKSVIPINIPEIRVGVKSINEEDNIQQCLLLESYYLDSLHIKIPLILNSETRLSTGLADVNSQHLLDKVRTRKSLKDFCESTFSVQSDQQIVVMIKDLDTSDGKFNGFIYCKTAGAKSFEYVRKDDCWYTLDTSSNDHLTPFMHPITTVLNRFLNEINPSQATWEQEKIVAESFYESIRTAFGLTKEEWDTVKIANAASNLDLEVIETKDKSFEFSRGMLAPSEPTTEVRKAILMFDANGLRELLKQRTVNKYYLKDVLIFCVELNCLEAFNWLLIEYKNLAIQVANDIILICQKMNRAEMINIITDKLPKLDITKRMLLNAARLCDSPTFDACRLLLSKIETINLEELHRYAIQNENWELACHLKNL